MKNLKEEFSIEELQKREEFTTLLAQEGDKPDPNKCDEFNLEEGLKI